MNKDRIDDELQDENFACEEDMTNEQEEVTAEGGNADKVTDWEQKYNTLNDSYLRLNAEFDNYRKRTLKEKSDLLKMGSERIFVDILNVVDDFERAIENMEKTDDVQAIKDGIDLIYNKFQNFLTKHHVKEIETIDQPFDADKHEAITTVPATKKEDKDKIIDCIQKGYTLEDKVIRFPKVIVAK